MLDVSQILKASLVTYAIGSPEGVLGANGVECIGFQDDLVAFESGMKEKDACYVGETDDQIILAFRGTAMKGIETQGLDWLNNFTAQPLFVPDFPGKVHKGFFTSILNLWNADAVGGFVTEVQNRVARSPEKELCITGYSKGGALTPLAAWLLHTLGVEAKTIYIFEPPKCGNADFADAFNKQFPQTQRYVYQNDLVPQVPPSDEFMALASRIPVLKEALSKMYGPDYAQWNYHPVGNRNFVNWDNQIVTGPPKAGFAVKWLAELAKNPLQGLAEHMPCDHLYPVIAALPDQKCLECKTNPDPEATDLAITDAEEPSA